MAYDTDTADRVRRLLSGRDDVEEKRMVGGISFLVGGRMCCGVTATGLLVRLPSHEVPEAVREPHVGPMTMGRKTLSGVVLVEPPGYPDDEALSAWLDRGISAASAAR